MYEGFVAAYTRRELSFDETYFDAIVALSGSMLKGPRPSYATKLLEPMERALGGSVLLKHNRFYVALEDGYMEAHLVAEGLRKIAAIAYLVMNGALADKSVLFWDEPEANLNPKLTRLVVDMLLELARQGVQVFLTTHDYLLSQHLSLLAEYRRTQGVELSFFSFARNENNEVTVESGGTLAELPANPIVEEFARHYDFEREMFHSVPRQSVRRK
jgi:predicted ATPase